jgi:hypothetical protein
LNQTNKHGYCLDLFAFIARISLFVRSVRYYQVDIILCVCEVALRPGSHHENPELHPKNLTLPVYFSNLYIIAELIFIIRHDKIYASFPEF